MHPFFRNLRHRALVVISSLALLAVASLVFSGMIGSVPIPLAEMWVRMCPAQVYELGEGDARGNAHVEINPSNCVQCGAITAKGGRLTPPEGGSGPEYTRT